MDFPLCPCSVNFRFRDDLVFDSSGVFRWYWQKWCFAHWIKATRIRDHV